MRARGRMRDAALCRCVRGWVRDGEEMDAMREREGERETESERERERERERETERERELVRH